MVHAVASERAVAAGWPDTDEFKAAIRDRVGHRTAIEVDETGLSGHSVRIMAGAARRLLVHDMESMPSVLAFCIGRAKTLVAQNAVAIVTFVAKSVVAKTLAAAVLEDEF